MTDTGVGQRAARPLAFVQPCLGSGEYNAEVRRRRTLLGPSRTIGELLFDGGNCTRARNATSSGSLSVPLGACHDVIELIRPWRDELWLYRDGDLLWCGPILNVVDDPDGHTTSISANDLTAWLSFRLFTHTMKPRGIDLARIFEGYFNYAMKGELPPWGEVQPGDPPVYADDPGVTISVTDTGVTGDRTVYHGDLKVVGSELEELSKTGVDWTCINRHVWAGGVEVEAPGVGSPLRLPGRMTEEAFATAPRLRRTGEGMATDVWYRGNGVRGHVGGPDPDDGILLQRVLDEYSIEDDASGRASAQGYYNRGRVELTYVEGDSSLAASAPVGIDTLIPGARALMDFGGEGRALTYQGWLGLDSVDIQFGQGAGAEVVRPTFVPLGSDADARGADG